MRVISCGVTAPSRPRIPSHHQCCKDPQAAHGDRERPKRGSQRGPARPRRLAAGHRTRGTTGWAQYSSYTVTVTRKFKPITQDSSTLPLAHFCCLTMSFNSEVRA